MNRSFAVVAKAVLILAIFVVAGCGGGGGRGSVTQVPGGVVPTNTPALLVADSTNTNAIQLSQTLANQGYKVDFAPSIPATTTTYAVVVIDETAQITSGSAATVKGLLDQGKGVVLLGRVPAILATGAKTCPADLTPISGWFGGATQLAVRNGVDTTSIRQNALIPIPASMHPFQQVYAGTSTDANAGIVDVPDDKIGPNAAQVIRTDGGNEIWAFAYTPTSGGRLYWQWSPSGTNSAYFDQVTTVFTAGTRWAAGF